MSTPETVTSEIQKLTVSAIIELYELDTENFGGDIIRFHGGTNSLNQNLVWQGETYNRFPIECSGFEMTGTGTLPRPTLTVSNILGTITQIMFMYRDLIGAKVTRKRTLAKYLDAVNFPGGVNASADPTAEFSDDVYYIDRKIAENRDIVQFELASPIDLIGIEIPRRQIIQNVCNWQYRSAECSYAGSNYFDVQDRPVATLAEDRCGKRLSSCKKRFGDNAQLPYGGFPACGMIR